MMKWYDKSGAQGDVAISTRVRLARNVNGRPFPARLSVQERRKIVEEVKAAVLESNSVIAGNFQFIDMEKLGQGEAVALVERHAVSPEFISDRSGRGLLLTKDEAISIMINEEDHLRIQVMKEGLCLEEAYGLADKLDTLLNERLRFAFDSRLGYLTQCPTNIGTGMRASLMLHLPALQQGGAMNRVTANLSKLGLAIRGIYGEGTEPVGAFYQLSNQVTLGLSENVAVSNLKSIAAQLMDQERSARRSLAGSLESQDAISRSLGILRSAKILSGQEFMKLISNVRLGISMSLINDVSYDTVNSLIVRVQPATMMLPTGKKLTAQERDVLRAETVSSALSTAKA